MSVVTRKQLTDDQGNKVFVDEGENASMAFTFRDAEAEGQLLTTSQFISLRVMLRNEKDQQVINGRDGTVDNASVLSSIADETVNGVTRAVLSLELDPADHVNIGTAAGQLEWRWLDLIWTYTKDGATKTGKSAFKYPVHALVTP